MAGAFLSGYLGQQQADNQNATSQIQQVTGALGLLSQIAAQHKAQQDQALQEAWRAKLSALGPNATHDDIARLAMGSGLMTPDHVATLAQGAENKQLQLDNTRQIALQRLTQQAAQEQRTHEYRLSTLGNVAERNAEIARHNAASEDINREASTLAGKRLDLALANTAFNQADKAANTAYTTGTAPAPTVTMPNAAPVAPPRPQYGNGSLVKLMADGQEIINPAEISAAKQVMQADARGQPMTVQMPAPQSNMDARDLALAGGRKTVPFGAQPAAATVQAAPSAAPVLTTAMPAYLASASPKVQDAWRAAQAKAEGKANISLAGGRESVFINRVILAGNEAAADLANVVKLPMTASRGMFGGRGQEKGIMNAGLETLANAMTTQEVQKYNVLATGFQRSLAAIEAAGLAPSGTLSHQMDSVLFKEGDTNFTKLLKLAQTRQIVEKGLETTLTNPRVPEETKAHMREIMQKVNKAVPFTPSDLLELESRQKIDPNITLGDVVGSQTAPASGGWSIRPK